MSTWEKYTEITDTGVHPFRAVKQFTDSEVREILLYAFEYCKPLKTNCQNVTEAQSFYIVTMCKAFDYLFRDNNKILPLRATACSLAASLNSVGKYLKGAGLITTGVYY